MASRLIVFLNSACTQFPSASMPLVEFIRAFRESLPARDRDSFSHSRIVSELGEYGFQIGQRDKTFWIGGLALRGTYEVDPKGKLVLKAAAERGLTADPKARNRDYSTR